MDPMQEFFELAEGALRGGTLVRCVLSGPRGKHPLTKITAVPVELKGELHLSCTFREARRDTTKNFLPAAALRELAQYLPGSFRHATLLTTTEDITLDCAGAPRLKRVGAPERNAPQLTHDRAKVRHIDPKAPWLHHLGIAAAGKIRPDRYDKFRQIDKFAEILEDLITRSPLAGSERVSVCDYGSGKSYLTFALYDLLSHRLKRSAAVVGVEARGDLVRLSTEVAKEVGFTGLSFVEGTIADHEPEGVDIVVALHACDTATDDALIRGITAGAKLIVVAPCCHKYLRKQLTLPPVLAPIFHHGSLEETLAVSVTDGLRAVALEASGYATSVFEFISPEHTPRNTMIAAIRSGSVDREGANRSLAELRAFFGLPDFYLDRALRELGA